MKFVSFSRSFDHLLLSLRQDAEGLPVEVKVRSKGDGLYACSYTPNSPLKHTVAVAWGGVGVPNSPFRVSSQSQDPVEAESAKAVQSEPLVTVESVKLVQSEPEESFKMLRSKSKDAKSKTKKPLIIITTYTEERYINRTNKVIM